MTKPYESQLGLHSPSKRGCLLTSLPAKSSVLNQLFADVGDARVSERPRRYPAGLCIRLQKDYGNPPWWTKPRVSWTENFSSRARHQRNRSARERDASAPAEMNHPKRAEVSEFCFTAPHKSDGN